MGNVTSHVNDHGVVAIPRPEKLSLASLTIKNGYGTPLLSVAPDSQFPNRIIPSRLDGSRHPVNLAFHPTTADSPVSPSCSLQLDADAGLQLEFAFAQSGADHGERSSLNGLTFAFASSFDELTRLTKLQSDPNLHRNPDVEFLGSLDFASTAIPSWQWTWRAPHRMSSRDHDGPTVCAFYDYDQNQHKLNLLLSFAFWVHASPHLAPLDDAKDEVANSEQEHSAGEPCFKGQEKSHSTGRSASDNEASQSDSYKDHQQTDFVPNTESTSISVSGPRAGADLSGLDDGPLFRATMKSLEQKTGTMRLRMKKLLRKAEAAQAAQVECNSAMSAFMEALRETSSSGGSAIQPAMEHYFEKIAKQILNYEYSNTRHVQKLIIDPLSRIYNSDIKQAESRKKDFEDESKDYYAYVSRYLGQRSDSLKEKKRQESDTKYQDKRRRFELKCFDYSSFIEDLHGGRKEQEVLSQLTRYAEVQSNSFMETASTVGLMMPQLETLIYEVGKADREFSFQKSEREEKRRTLEKTASYLSNPDTHKNTVPNEILINDVPIPSINAEAQGCVTAMSSLQAQSDLLKPGQASTIRMEPPLTPDRFKGFRDLEERDQVSNDVAYRKEGLLWALSKPDSHVDIKALNKQSWHK